MKQFEPYKYGTHVNWNVAQNIRTLGRQGMLVSQFSFFLQFGLSLLDSSRNEICELGICTQHEQVMKMRN